MKGKNIAPAFIIKIEISYIDRHFRYWFYLSDKNSIYMVMFTGTCLHSKEKVSNVAKKQVSAPELIPKIPK